MKKLLFKITFLISMILLSIVIIMKIAPIDKNNYLMEIVDKQNMLENTKSPRLILVGGSNLAFGIDSKKIQESIHMPVINMGLHAGLGLKFMLDDVKPYIKEGDIIVIIPEYEHFYDTTLNGELGTLTYVFLNSNPKAMTYVDYQQLKTVLKGISPIFHENIKKDIDKYIYGKSFQTTPSEGVYRRDGFNAQGDVITHLNMKPEEIAGFVLNENSAYNEETIKCLNEFNAFSNKKNAKVYFDFPPIPQGKYTTDKVNYVYEQLKSDLKFDLLGTQDEYVFPLSYFFNTVYHLNADGRQIRTDKLINDLKKLNN